MIPFPTPLRWLIALILSCACAGAGAQGTTPPNTPAGLWRTIDDNTGQPAALVRITRVNSEYIGRVEKIFPGVADKPAPTCDECEGTLKGQPVLGMVILKGVRRSPEPNADEFAGGEILDPGNGKTYRALLTMADGGRKLNVRGYFVVTLVGRTQVWEREE